MSDSSQPEQSNNLSTNKNSILTNLTNTLTYNIQKAVYNPDANDYIEQKKEQKEQEEQEQKERKAVETATDTTGDPNTFSGKRTIKKIGSQTLDILKKIIIPFASLMLAMIVANEMIMYPVPIRIIFFVFTLLIGIMVPFYIILLGIFYILKGGYSYWRNNMTDAPKRHIMPTIFALLPITTTKPLTRFGKIFMYPFYYPKTEDGTKTLQEIMEEYWNDLVASYKYYDTIKNIQPFEDNIKKLEVKLSNLHKVIDVQTNNTSNTNTSNTNTTK